MIAELKNSLKLIFSSSRLASGTFWLFSSTIIEQGIKFLSTLFVARFLGKNDYGAIGIISSTIITISTVANLGLGLTATKTIAEYKELNKDKLGQVIFFIRIITFLISCFVSIFCLINSRYISIYVLNDKNLQPAFEFAIIQLFFTIINGWQIGALTGFEAYREIAEISVIRGILTFTLTIILTRLLGIRGFFIAMSIISIFNWIANNFVIRRKMKDFQIQTKLKLNSIDLHFLWKFSLPAYLSGIIVTPVTWISNTIIVKMQNGFGELGIYNAANQWKTILLFIPSIFVTISLPILADKKINSPENEEVKLTIEKIQSYLLICIVPLALIIMFFSDFIMSLYGTSYIGRESILICLICGVLIQSIGSVTGPLIQARFSMWIGLLINLIWGSTYLISVVALTNMFSGLGLALSYCISYSFLNIFSFLYLRNMLPKGFMTRNILFSMYVFIITLICSICSKALTHLIFLPIFIITIFLLYFFFTDKKIWDAIIRKIYFLFKKSTRNYEQI